METMTTAQKIERLETELVQLKKQLAEELKAEEQRNQELDNLKEQINVFNCKYGTEYVLAVKSSQIPLSALLGW